MSKPPYRIPTMVEVAAARGSAGLSVASTFSGCGGSCLGFEMAGYRVLWASEFVEAARASYAPNHPETILDGRDVRQVKGSDVLGAIGLERGELDVLNGSPPCQAFSSAGIRDRGWGKVASHGDGSTQRSDDLFFEFARLVEELQPRAFVAENVAGLTRGRALGYFKEIMRALMAPGYRVGCKILDAQWLGVPQTRQRAIFIGIREDFDREPDFPKPLAHRYVLRDVLPDLARGARFFHGKADAHPNYVQGDKTDQPCPTTLAGASESEKLRVYPPGARLPDGTIVPIPDECWLPEGTAVRRNWDSIRPGKSHPRNFSTVRSSMDHPSPSVLAFPPSAASTWALTVPNEPRRFTIPELKIICSFPADFELVGSYGQQWTRLGNAVPPLMMRAIAGSLRDGLFAAIGRRRKGWREAA